MERQKGTNIIALVALVVAVVGVTLGFAAFSNTLEITQSATVTPNESTFNIDFSTVSDSESTTGMTINATTGATGNATISNDSDTNASLTNLTATFSNIGQTVTYNFYARNTGEYDAWLKAINFANAEGENSFIKCIPNGSTNADMVANACETISVTVKVGSDNAVSTTTAFDVSTHELKVGNPEPVVVTVSYAGDSSKLNSARADGPFTVKIGKISLNYGSVK